LLSYHGYEHSWTIPTQELSCASAQVSPTAQLRPLSVHNAAAVPQVQRAASQVLRSSQLIVVGLLRTRHLLALLLNTLVTAQQCALGLALVLGAEASGASALCTADAASRF
jgi:hypothetical protein